MERRKFLKLSIAATVVLPSISYAKKTDFSQIRFSNNNNNAQTIILFLYGGASQLAGNLSNYEEIEEKSQNSYKGYFTGGNKIVKTQNNFWEKAGGSHLEAMLADGDLTIFRTCYSKQREESNNKAHGVCVSENQKGSFNQDSAGMITNLAQILESNGVIDSNTIMPFVTLEGASSFFEPGQIQIQSFLRPVQIGDDNSNPFKRYIRSWFNYTPMEREIENYNNADSGFDPALDAKIDALAQKINKPGKIKDAFTKRKNLESLVENIKSQTTPDLGENAYSKTKFSKKIETAVKVLIENPDTKVVTLGTEGLGGWDDHSQSTKYIQRSEDLFRSLKSAMAHIKAKEKDGNINIIVFGDFGRNVNLNNSNGWDHGNLQNLYILGGKNYFTHQGIVGETIVTGSGESNRLFLKPKMGSYEFEPLSIAATLYKIYGVENPELLTEGYEPINI